MQNIVVCIVLILTTMLGLTIQLLAFVYFFHTEREGLSNKLRLMLILSDTSFLICTHLMSVCAMSSETTECKLYFFPMLLLGTLQVGMITSIIATIKAIAVAAPFYIINSTLVYKTVIILTIGNALQALPYALQTFKDEIMIINVIQMAIEVILTTISTGIIIYRLRQAHTSTSVNNFSEREQHNWYIIKTIIIKSVTFNVTTVIGVMISVLFERLNYSFLFPFQGFVFCLSSIINALVYILRCPGLRRYAVHLLIQHQNHTHT